MTLPNNASARNRTSLVALFLVLAGILVGHFTLPRLKHQYYTQELTFDVTSYYLYLPMTFIYDDPGIRNKATIDTLFARYNPSPTFYQAFELENGNRVMNYTCGFAYAYAPFFFLAHSWATGSNYPADGFSFPYQLLVGLGVYCYILFGWIILRRLLLRYFSDTVTAFVLLFTCFGTNYFSEAVNNYLQPHAMLFTGYAVLLYCISKWHEQPKRKYMVAGGLVMGWMVLSRPSEIVCVLLPLLWGVYDKESLRAKWELVRKNFSHVLILVVCGIVVFIPQFIYWHKVTGSAIFFSYQRTEGFDFLKPHILNNLFSFKKSLFVYTPILIFPLIGLFLIRRYNRYIQWAVVAYAAVNFYLLASWAAWWNGGSFGMRYFAESYAVMTLPFGYVITELGKRQRWLRLLSGAALSFFVFLNLFQTWQFLHWIIPDDRMTYAYYKRIFLKTKVTDEDRKLMEVERSFAATETFDNEQEYDHFTQAFYDFDSLNSGVLDPSRTDTTFAYSGKHSCKLSPEYPYYPTYRIRYDQLVPWNKDHVWLRVSCWYYSKTDIRENPASLVIVMPHKKYNLKYRAFDFEQQPFVPGQWNKITADYMTPRPYSEADKFEIYAWYRGNSEIWIDNFQVEAFVRKDP
ncbi:MAG TPA: hypothetical protein P5292_05365 [Bacteroidia bacterium]|nr:hypothetical protein [Bacteroidia bacterium]